METPLEQAAWDDYHKAQTAFREDPSEANREAYEAATWAVAAALERAIKTGKE